MDGAVLDRSVVAPKSADALPAYLFYLWSNPWDRRGSVILLKPDWPRIQDYIHRSRLLLRLSSAFLSRFRDVCTLSGAKSRLVRYSSTPS